MKSILRSFGLAPLVIVVLAGCAESLTQNAPLPEPAPTPMNARVDTLATGSFVNKGGQTTTGAYRIERVNGDVRLVLVASFRTDAGPDLHVVLSPTSVASAENNNALVPGALIIAPLASRVGAQVYDLRDDLSLAAFNSVLIHCVRFTHLYGAAPLR